MERSDTRSNDMRDVLKVYRLSHTARVPTRANLTDAGLDLYAAEDMFIPWEQRRKIPTGIAMVIPNHLVGLIDDKSSRADRDGLKRMGGVIDPGYRGEIQVLLHNTNADYWWGRRLWTSLRYTVLNKVWPGLGDGGILIKRGEKVAQMLLLHVERPPIVEVDRNEFLVDVSDRGDRGFGSSGL